MRTFQIAGKLGQCPGVLKVFNGLSIGGGGGIISLSSKCEVWASPNINIWIKVCSLNP